MTHKGTSKQKVVNVCFCRMIKEATKEKGTDDFLGKVILKLQVINYGMGFSLFCGSSS